MAKSTEAYSKQAKTQTDIMEKNNELTRLAMKNAEKIADHETLLKRYERLTNEMVNFIAPLYSRIEDNQVFNLNVPTQKIYELRGSIDDIKRETYSFWENYRRNKYLNQSDYVERMFHNYFAAIDGYRITATIDPRNEAITAEMKTQQESFVRYRASLFDAIAKRYSEIQKELGELENELGIQEKYQS